MSRMPDSAPKKHSAGPARRLHVEPLEDRRLLSSVPFLDPIYDVGVQSNVLYGTGSVGNPASGQIDLLLDLYSPTGPDAPALSPGLILIHGGGGNKAGSNMVTWATEFASRGYVVASISYRTFADNPTQEPGLLDPSTLIGTIVNAAINDATLAVVDARSDVGLYNIDPSRIAIAGASAGAISAFGVGYQELGAAAEVGAVMGLWGTIDDPLQPGLQTDVLSEFDANDPPLFLTVGTNDLVVGGALFYEANVAMANHAQQIGLPHEFFPLAGAGHGAWSDYYDDVVDGKTVFEHSVDFLYEHLDLAALPLASSITGPQLFYNQSKFDNNTPGIDPADSAAIATDKTAYLPGSGTITSASMSSYARGINGLFVDLTQAHGPLSLADFGFAISGQGVEANNSPTTWSAAPAPIGFTVLSDTPAAGTDRVEFIWADHAIENRYLEIRVFGNDAAGGNNTNTGLAATDVSYFGHITGDTFNDASPVVWLTTAADETAIQASPIISPATIDSLFDLDRNGVHLASDRIVSRSNTIFALNKISIANPPAAPAAPPSNAGPAGSAVAPALTIPASDNAADTTWPSDPPVQAPRGDAVASDAVQSHPLPSHQDGLALAELTDAAAEPLRFDDQLLDQLAPKLLQ